MIFVKESLDKIKTANKIAVYGAGDIARNVKLCLENTPFNKKIDAFIVTSSNNNPSDIEGTPVVALADAGAYCDALLLVAMGEKLAMQVRPAAWQAGFKNIIFVNSSNDLSTEIRKLWFLEQGMLDGMFSWHEKIAFNNDSYNNKSSDSKLSHIYVVKSAVDRQLKDDNPYADFEIPIQVGADLTDKSIFSIKDNAGDNISSRNKRYCELTALYWIWKNDKQADILGLSHYRRRFCLSEELLKDFVNSDCDALVTVPIFTLSGVYAHYIKDHSKNDWEIMLEAIEKISPEYLKATRKIEKQKYFYAYNMFIAKREFFDKYCEWLFPILIYCDEHIPEYEDTYQNRVIGFLAERLLSIFIEHNTRYKIGIIDKHFNEGE